MNDRNEAEIPHLLRVVDAHTEGEPTRVVVENWPAFRASTTAGRRDEVRNRFDALRAGVVCEPRGHDAMVAAILTPPESADSVAGVVFCNNVGVLGMCGHGLMGVARVLERLGRVSNGRLKIDTPVGPVGARLLDGGTVEIENVASYLQTRDVRVRVDGIGEVVGDVAYGGNWFFLARTPPPRPLRLAHAAELLRASEALRAAFARDGVRGRDGAEIDHVEWFEPSDVAHERNFTMCPGGAFDRSPCGTGTSAHAAALASRGELAPGEVLRVESVAGGIFEATVARRGEEFLPILRGRAFVTAETSLIFDPADPFRAGFVGG